MATFSIGTAFTEGWEATKKYWYYFISYLIGLGILNFIIVLALGRGGSALGILGTVITALISIIAGVAFMRFSLQIIRGEKPEWGDLFKGLTGSMVGNYVVAAIITGVLTAIGMVLLIIPGVIFWLSASQVFFLVIDKGMNPVDAIKESMRIMNGNRVTILGFFILIYIIILVSGFLLFLPLLVLLPLVFFAQASMYQQLITSDAATPKEA